MFFELERATSSLVGATNGQEVNLGNTCPRVLSEKSCLETGMPAVWSEPSFSPNLTLCMSSIDNGGPIRLCIITDKDKNIIKIYVAPSNVQDSVPAPLSFLVLSSMLWL